jgi:hypothetical protein
MLGGCDLNNINHCGTCHFHCVCRRLKRYMCSFITCPHAWSPPVSCFQFFTGVHVHVAEANAAASLWLTPKCWWGSMSS